MSCRKRRNQEVGEGLRMGGGLARRKKARAVYGREKRRLDFNKRSSFEQGYLRSDREGEEEAPA